MIERDKSKKSTAYPGPSEVPSAESRTVDARIQPIAPTISIRTVERQRALEAIGGNDQLISEFEDVVRGAHTDFWVANIENWVSKFPLELQFPLAVALVTGEDPHSRRTGARVLGFLENKEKSVPILAEILGDKNEDPVVRRMAALALAAIGPSSFPALHQLVEGAKETGEWGLKVGSMCFYCRSAISELGLAAIPDLLNTLKSAPVDVSIGIVAALGAMGDIVPEEAIPTLIELLDHTDPGLVAETARALWRIGEKCSGATEKLVELINHQDRGVRFEAAQALASIAPESEATTSALLAAFKQKPEDKLADALRGQGATAICAIPLLLEVVTNNSLNMYLRCASASAVGEIGRHLRDDDKSEIKKASTQLVGQDYWQLRYGLEKAFKMTT